jgi:hypothetical protein
MIYTICIQNKEERIRFAAKLQKLLALFTEYIPGKRQGIYDVDIGIKAQVTEKELAKIDSLIERRGYQCSKRGSLRE